MRWFYVNLMNFYYVFWHYINDFSNMSGVTRHNLTRMNSLQKNKIKSLDK
jgi:hypothetical protein